MEGFCHPNVETSQTPGSIQQNSICMSQQISYLLDLLAKERAYRSTEYHWRIQLGQELEEHKQELVRQKKLKEMFINRGKETKQELEMLQKYSNAEALSATKIASQVNNTIKRKKKKDLQKDYEELKVAHIINQEKFNNEVQLEKDKNKLLQEEMENFIASFEELYQSQETNQEKFNTELQEEKEKKNDLQEEMDNFIASFSEYYQSQETNQEKFNTELQEEKKKKKDLQEELEKLRALYHYMSESYKADVLAARQKVDHYQNELEIQIRFQDERVLQDELLVKHLRDEQDSLRRQTEEMRLMQQNASEQETILQQEMEELKTQFYTEVCGESQGVNTEVCQSHATNQEKFNTELQEEKEKKNDLQEEMENFIASFSEYYQSQVTNQEKFNTELQEDEKKKNVLLEKLEKLSATYDEDFQRYISDVSSTELTEDESLSNVLPDPKPKETGLPEKTEKPKKASFWKRVRRFVGLRRRRKKEVEEVSGANIPQQLC